MALIDHQPAPLWKSRITQQNQLTDDTDAAEQTEEEEIPGDEQDVDMPDVIDVPRKLIVLWYISK